MSTSGGNAQSWLYRASAHLDSDAIRTMNSDPTEIVGDALPGQAWIVADTVAEYVGTTGSFDTDDGFGIFYGSGTPDETLVAQRLFLGDALVEVPPTGLIIPGQVQEGFTTAADADGASLVVGATNSDPQSNGTIVTTTLDDGGTGYDVGDTGTIDQPISGTEATYTVSTVGALGVVLTYTVTAGTGLYGTDSNPHATTAGGGQPGIGTGLSLNVTAVVAAVGDLYVTVAYYAVTIH